VFALGSVEEVFIEQTFEVVRGKFYMVPVFDGIAAPPQVLRRGEQLNGAVLLEQVSSLSPDALVRVGITAFDLYENGLNFIFGIASNTLMSCVVSYFRLFSEDVELYTLRFRKEVTHELGHVFGLSHCPNPGCVMHFSNSLLDTDRKGEDFCSTCRERLELSLKSYGLL